MEPREDPQRDNIKPYTSPAGARNGAPESEAAEETQSFGQWLASNGFSLVVVLGAIGYVLWKFDIEGVWAIVKALIGLSLVIFIHELGHFLAAKWCDVHVTTFSIGFGPAIPGCWFQWGETTYKLSLLPLGGYVQMVGQVDGDESSDGSEDDPRSFRNKGVGQRMLIISAGVIMNAILACICFIVVYQGPGKLHNAAVVNVIDSGAPAFKAGVPFGAQVMRIDEIDHPTFEDLMYTVVFSAHAEKIPLVWKRPGDARATAIEIEPRLGPADTRPVIGVGPSQRLELASRRFMVAGSSGPFGEGSPAALASPGFQYGDEILATTDPDDPTKVVDLPKDPRNTQREQRDYFEFERRMQQLAGREATVRVRRAGPEGKIEDILVPPAYHLSLGVRMQMGEVIAVRQGSPAEQAGLLAPRSSPDKTAKFKGDIIFKVEIPEPDGKTTVFSAEGPNKLDPDRLPYQLQQWAERVRRADKKVPLKVTLHVHRHPQEGLRDQVDEKLELDWDDSWRYDRILPLHPDSPLAIPELGLAYQIKPFVAEVLPGIIEDSPLQADDEIVSIKVTAQVGKHEHASELEIKNNFAHVSYALYERPSPVKSVEIKIKRAKTPQTVTLTAVADKSWPLIDRGWVFMPDERLEKADGFAEAISFGMRDTWRNVRQVGQTIWGMLTGRLSIKNLGGPLTIARTAYSIAGYDIWEFIFFLGMVSINLAVINFLPIPVLDGGHMVFLVYEKLRGRQAPESVRVGATYAGLAIILSLIVFVLWLDVLRWK